MTVAFANEQSLGYVQFTNISTSSPLSLKTSVPSTGNTGVPQGANSIVISVEGAAIRWRDDNGAPSSTVGMPVANGASLAYAGNLPQFEFIGQSAGATVNVTYYY